MRAIVYVDGFNLYYQLRGTAYKWLNLSLLVRSMLSDAQVASVNYYTAEVLRRDGRNRQKNYWRALATTPEVSLRLGRFKVEDGWMRPAGGVGPKIHVEKTIEKQTDVSIGADMVHDAHRGLADCFVLVSNDSDQLRPLQIIRQELHKKVVLINPNPGYPARELRIMAARVMDLTGQALQRSQFRPTLQDSAGTFSIPTDWYNPT